MKHQIDPAPSSGNPIGGYYYRRPLSASELLPAVSVGLGAALLAGLATFYLTKIYLQRTPLLPDQRRLDTHPASSRAT